jgi:hypothetical protein
MVITVLCNKKYDTIATTVVLWIRIDNDIKEKNFIKSLFTKNLNAMRNIITEIDCLIKLKVVR